jgi:hypothetical protein
MSDEDAYMALALCNAQGELHPLEEGLHALGSGLSGSEYARRTGTAQRNIADRICAATAAEISAYPFDASRIQIAKLGLKPGSLFKGGGPRVSDFHVCAPSVSMTLQTL